MLVLNNKKTSTALLLVSIVPLLFLLRYQINVFGRINGSLLEDQRYSSALSWLKDNTEKNSVILANDSISAYIPMLTDNYILFNHYVGFHIMSDYEVEERYLVSRMFSGLTKEQLKTDFRKYAGVGNSIHQVNFINRKIRICLKLKSILTNLNCGNLISVYDMKGESYFDALMERYYVIKKDPKKFLDMYRVSYVVVDKQKDVYLLPKAYKLIWSSEDFSVFVVK